MFGGGQTAGLRKEVKGKAHLGRQQDDIRNRSMLVCGIAIGAIESPFLPYLLPVSVLLSLGAVIGDLLGSFIKGAGAATRRAKAFR